MSLRLIIEDKYKSAIKAKNINEVKTFRLIKSAIKDKDISLRTKENFDGIGDKDILALLQNLIKQRRDSIDSFIKASREDLILIEQNEIDIISQFLPQQINKLETENLINKIMKDQNLVSIKDMGKLMNELKINHAGSIDMTLAGKIAKSKFIK